MGVRSKQSWPKKRNKLSINKIGGGNNRPFSHTNKSDFRRMTQISQIPQGKKPHVWLVGAGPGDPELFTLKGIRVLETADVVLYDALANESLLDYAPNAVKIPVGKRKGKHSASQETINELLVECAFRYGNVVRLKGGDPFVFGRGHEEMAFVQANGISVTIVPGISSSYAVPAGQQIPLTTRGLSESFWVITGHTRDGLVSEDLRLAARSTATIVILMGVSHIQEIMAEFGANRRWETPVAVIQNGSMPNEKIALGTVENIAEEIARLGIGSPAVIVVGEVVRTHPAYATQAARVAVLETLEANAS